MKIYDIPALKKEARENLNNFDLTDNYIALEKARRAIGKIFQEQKMYEKELSTQPN